ncbi:MAG: tRNA (adenosine(37)-N6)-threonylcarbamoyltransferase complex dimerization subunit type 1 TsaB [Limisphaerales bacterium]
MKILALEFSSLQRSVAVVQGAGGGQGQGVIASWESAMDNRGHRSADSLGLTEEALRKGQVEREEIECVAVGIGPGSYTGIRAAIALAQGWQLARGVRLLAISSAECLAAQGQAEGLLGRVEVVIDAQRNEFYLAGYDISAGGWLETEPLRLVTLAEAQERQRAGGRLIGPEASRWFPGSRVLFPHAATLGRLALGRSDFVAGEDLQPIYLRETKFVKHSR